MTGVVERAAELRVLEAALDAATERRPTVAVVEGPPGTGKTALLAVARERALERGCRVRSGTAHALEQGLPYGVTTQLFGAPPALDEAPGELAVLHGFHLLSAADADRQTLVLVVDDLQWADDESLRALLYVVRRAEGLRLAVLAGHRPADVARPALEAVLAAATTTVRPAALSAAGVTAVLTERYDGQPTPAFARAVLAATGGVPLLVQELARALSAEGVAPDDAGAALVPGFVSPDLARTLLRRVQHLPEDALRLAQAFAVLGTPTPVAVAAELARLPPDDAVRLAVALADADVLTHQAEPGVAHPVLEAALLGTVAPARRAEGHQRAAHLLARGGAPPEEVAQHLLAAPVQRDDDAYEVLVAAGREASGRAAPRAAVRFLRAALDACPLGRRTDDARLLLGTLEAQVGDALGEERLRELVASDAAIEQRAAAALALAELLSFAGRGAELAAVVDDALLAEAGERDPELRLRLLAAVVPGRFLAGAPVPDVEAVAELSEGGRELEAALAVTGSTAAGVLSRCHRAVLGTEALPTSFERSSAMFFALSRLVHCDDLDLAERLLDRSEHPARQRGAPIELGRRHYLRAVLALQRGDLPTAVAEADAGLELVDVQGRALWSLATAVTTTALADALRLRGDLARAGAVLGAGDGPPRDLGGLVLVGARARLAAATGRHGEAVALLEAILPFAGQRSLEMMFLHVRPLLATLLVAGERERAEELATAAYDEATAWGLPRCVGEALVARGLVTGGERGLVLLREAVDVLTTSPARYDEARARVELGAALRRTGRDRDARGPLQEGMELAARCGAEPLVERALTELRAAGARPRRTRLTGAAALTASELRVARLAAEGLGNADVAQALFVSRKTVEKHLGSVYAKLGISSRAGLSGALDAAAPDRP